MGVSAEFVWLQHDSADDGDACIRRCARQRGLVIDAGVSREST